ncbi:TPA: hypothetical protein ACTXXA_001680 [Legionella anisa]
MTIKVAVKLDDNKIRIYLKSNDATIEAIEDYLKTQEYTNIASLTAVEEKANAKKSQGYSLKPYSLAYNNLSQKENILIEAWFNIGKHFTDETLATTIDTLIAPVMPTINDAILPSPNMKVKDLQPRVYVTVFEEKNASLGDVLKLVRNLESCVKNVRKQALLESDKIPSDVVIAFDDKVTPAKHAKGLSIFGLMPASQSNGPVSNSSNSYSL